MALVSLTVGHGDRPVIDGHQISQAMIARWGLPWTFRLLALMTLALGVVSSTSYAGHTQHTEHWTACIVGLEERIHCPATKLLRPFWREGNVQVLSLHPVTSRLLCSELPVLHTSLCQCLSATCRSLLGSMADRTVYPSIRSATLFMIVTSAGG